MKSVALVGAAVLRGQLGQEIDSHDAVARLKFFGAAFLQPVDEAGKRTDIAFYNKAMSRELNLVLADSRSHHRRQVDTLKFLISKKALPDRRYVKLKTAPTYLTPASLGNSAIFHVLLARPSTLKVYGFDLYTGGVAHSPSDFNETLLAARGLKRDQLHYRLSFFQHNPISQIRFIRNLRRAGRLSASRQVLDVLELTDELYARRLENRFGLGSDVV